VTRALSRLRARLRWRGVARVACVVAATVAFVAHVAPVASAADFEGVATAFQQALSSKQHETRLRAFEMLKSVEDPRAVDLLLKAAKNLVDELDKGEAELGKSEQALEAALSEIDKMNSQGSPGEMSAAQVEAFNRKAAKLEGKRDKATERLKEARVARDRTRGLVDAATRTLGEVVERLKGPEIPPAIAKIEAAWLGEKATADDRIRFVDVLARVKTGGASDRLKALVADAAQDPRVRSVAIGARAGRGDAGAVDEAVALLADPSWQVQAAAIDALRTLHVKEGIEPLIKYLGREDVGRLRTDARRALRSLTAQTHGPFQQPWADWWATAKDAFQMPPRPRGLRSDEPPGGKEEGVTFYGITTFSGRVLFVLDVSGSMTELAHPGGAGVRGTETKFDVARKELDGALDLMDATKKFNVVYFSHEVTRYQPGMLVAEKATRDQAKRFAAQLVPSGGTNIHDALEAAFRIAGFGADRKTYEPLVDTVYFMTDGRPTAGKVQEPEAILAEVREWNRAARLTIHAIGVGDADPVFLQALAAENGGTFVKR
jgi:HEAT repeat protein